MFWGEHVEWPPPTPNISYEKGQSHVKVSLETSHGSSPAIFLTDREAILKQTNKGQSIRSNEGGSLGVSHSRRTTLGVDPGSHCRGGQADPGDFQRLSFIGPAWIYDRGVWGDT